MRDHDEDKEGKRTMVSSSNHHSTNTEEQERSSSFKKDVTIGYMSNTNDVKNEVDDGEREQNSSSQSNGQVVSEFMTEDTNSFSGQNGNGQLDALGGNCTVSNGAVSKNIFQHAEVHQKDMFPNMENGSLAIPSPVLGPTSVPPSLTVPTMSMSKFDDNLQSQEYPQNKSIEVIKIAAEGESNDVTVKTLSPIASTSSSSVASNVPPSGQDIVSTQPTQPPIMNGGATSTSDVDVDIDSILNSPKAKDDIVEKSPGGRYLRFSEKLGSGAYKEVYRAYDTSEGIEVAWNVVHLSGINKAERQYIVNEVRLLEKLNHSNIISFHGSWVNRQEEQVIFVTEILSSGTLKQFINKVKVIRYKIAKRWAIQILKGLSYLHSQDPPIIHRDLKCDNIFINGTSGDLRIGDLGLSTVMSNSSKALSVLGTPEFMAPELYDESYDEKIDIYAFGMCMLEICTKEVPYRECTNPAQIYKKVTMGIEPESLKRIRSSEARDFIRQCLGHRDEAGKVTRPSASELLEHPFLISRESDDSEIEVDLPLRERTISEGPPSLVRSAIQSQQVSIPDDIQIPSIDPNVKNGSVVSSKGALSPRTLNAEEVVEGLQLSAHQPTQKSVPLHHASQEVSCHYDDMPQSESNMRKVKVMMGRDEELEENREGSKDGLNAPAPLSSPALGFTAVARQQSVSSNQPMSTHSDVPSVVSASTHVKLSTQRMTSNGSDTSNQLLYQNCPLESTLKYMKMASILEDSSMGVPYSNNIMHLRLTLKLGVDEQHVQFGFHLIQDDAVQVAREMVKELHLPQDATLEISETISSIARQARIHQGNFKIGIQQNMPHLPQHQHTAPLHNVGIQMPMASHDNALDRSIDSLYEATMNETAPLPSLSSHPQYFVPVPSSTPTHFSSDPIYPSAPYMYGSQQVNAAAIPQTTPIQSTSTVIKSDQENVLNQIQHHSIPNTTTSHRESSSSILPQSEVSALQDLGVKSISLPDLNTADPDLSPLIDEVDNLLSDDDDDISNSSELKKLAIEHEKKKKRAEKAFHTRMENLQRSKEEKEALHQKTLEKHEKEREALEKRLKQAEEEQQQRLKKLEDEFVQQRAKAKQSVKSYPPLHPNIATDIPPENKLESSLSSLVNMDGIVTGPEHVSAPSPTPSHTSNSSIT
jgi:WNK lysine deficient protein kinase